eukprot:TRINITY_DN72752_c0_g1_i1.p4 TRINITY_DN72752_c0_g1~~TRINITY_DN72752_c0_g1_i1.p4  ORF type:complete len:139 (+),score=3.03 TRINITY_DN72752_c0_g1_i1:233-649(+)
MRQPCRDTLPNNHSEDMNTSSAFSTADSADSFVGNVSPARQFYPGGLDTPRLTPMQPLPGMAVPTDVRTAQGWAWVCHTHPLPAGALPAARLSYRCSLKLVAPEQPGPVLLLQQDPFIATPMMPLPTRRSAVLSSSSI